MLPAQKLAELQNAFHALSMDRIFADADATVSDAFADAEDALDRLYAKVEQRFDEVDALYSNGIDDRRDHALSFAQLGLRRIA